MKIKKIIVLLCLITFIGMYKVNAETLSYESTGYYFMRNDPVNGHHTSDEFKAYYIDGTVSYCIEPDIHEGTNGYSLGSFNDTNLSQDVIEKVKLIGYYGYSYFNHQTLKYRMATQALIWEAILGEGSWVKFSTDYWNRGDEIDISLEKEEINNLVNYHYILPSFSGVTFSVNYGNNLYLVDVNNVLANFDINIANGSFISNDNSLAIIPSSDESVIVNFTRKKEYSKPYKIFVGNGIQNIYTIGNVEDVKGSMQVNVKYYSSLEIIKKDSETGENPQGETSFKGTEYAVYSEDSVYIKTLTTDEHGHAFSGSFLPKGKYYIEELTAPVGYEKDSTRYYFEASYKTPIIRIEVYDKAIKNQISVFKQTSDKTNGLMPESDITFEIYDASDNKYDEITTNAGGYAFIDLPYGNWTFRQINSTFGYKKTDDFSVIIDDKTDKTQYFNLIDEAESSYLKIIKIDSKSLEPIRKEGFKFKILNINTNEFLKLGNNEKEIATNNLGEILIDSRILIGKYKLIEVETPIGYVIDSTGIDFVITGDEEVVSVLYPNKLIEGNIKIFKTDKESLIPLSTIKYSLYNENDEVINEGTTDEKGQLIFHNIKYGKYYIKESITKEGYLLDEDKHYFEIKNDGETINMDLVNTKIKSIIKIYKTDEIGNPLEGVQINVYDADNKLISSDRSNSDGIIELVLPYGKYYYMEEESLDGYTKDNNKYYFEIEENDKAIESRLINIPKTSSNNYGFVYKAQVLALILSMIVLKYEKKRL